MVNRSFDNTPLEIYHGVPVGWSKIEVAKEDWSLGNGVAQYA